ncbi:MAG: CDP-alcohol phosphatidyltransferase family protein [Lachnospirales bacterium]
MIGYYNYSVILTYIGLCSAIFGTNLALDGHGSIRGSLICLMICGLCDMFDGTIARTCKRSEDAKTFGMEIDSLCDLVCFGVYPVIIGYGLGNRSLFSVACGMFYVLAAVIRLGFFNVQEINRKINKEDKRTNYTGLPVTSCALLIPTVMLFDLTNFFSIVRYYDVMLLIIGILFISPFKVKKLYLQGLLCLACLGILVFVLVVKYGQLIQLG